MVKKYDIEIPKKDYLILQLSIKENGENVKLDENDLIFMTVKTYSSKEEYIFQKSLENGITYNEDTKKYEIEIESNDTKNLLVKEEYGYDITIYYDGNKPKQKVKGKIKIGEKFTLNEVS